jgi:putative phosphoribosyl transferase
MRAGLPFPDRSAAGQALGAELQRHTLLPPGSPPPGGLLVLGLPRGGVAVAAPVALALSAPLDVLTVRKVGLPHQPELAVGAIAALNVSVRDPLGVLGTDAAVFEQLARQERPELDRRERLYRAGRGPLELAGRTVVLVDDGLATGATMLAAVRAARSGHAARVIAAVPVASPQAVRLLAREADQVIALHAPPELTCVGQWYQDFAQLDDGTVCALLAATARPARPKR